jgi:LacI family transcriptional regulator
VAQFAGVSTATVSYVMNKTRAVRSETEQKVRLAIEVLGYMPNAHARELAMLAQTTSNGRATGS